MWYSLVYTGIVHSKGATMASEGNITLYLGELRQVVEKWAEEDDRSISWIIRNLIEKEQEQREGVKDETKNT